MLHKQWNTDCSSVGKQFELLVSAVQLHCDRRLAFEMCLGGQHPEKENVAGCRKGNLSRSPCAQ